MKATKALANINQFLNNQWSAVDVGQVTKEAALQRLSAYFWATLDGLDSEDKAEVEKLAKELERKNGFLI